MLIALITISIILCIYSDLTRSNGVSFSRTVKSLAKDSTFNLLFDSGCKSTDSYGSNNCQFNWGSLVSGYFSGKLGHDLQQGSKFSVNFKVDKFISWKFTCAACGANCTTTIPVIDQEVTFATPPCPISATEVIKQIFNSTLPVDSPTPVKVTATGDVILTDASNNNIIDLYLDITIQ